jgi:signal transduction histidine kinase
LEGYGEQWIQLSTKREATFTNLDPGEYVLRVKGSNNDGVWNEEGASLKIIITPPWWQTLWFRILSIVTLVGLVISAHRIRTASIKARNRALEQEIAERKKLLEELESSHARLRALTAHLHAIAERERVTIARDLHDELGGLLTSLKIDLAVMERRFDQAESSPVLQATEKDIRAMKSSLDFAIANVREFIRKLRPEILDSAGLVGALEWQLQEFHKHSGVAYEFQSDATALAVDEECAIAVFRIFQEALTNVSRHAHAGKVSVKIMKHPDHAVIEIMDNGIGIPQEKLEKTATFGLLGMRERALMFEGEVRISGSPGKGTSVMIKIPIT